VAHPGDGLARQHLNAVEVRCTSIERDRQGERISTGIVESTEHQGGAIRWRSGRHWPDVHGARLGCGDPYPDVQRGVDSGMASVGARSASPTGLEGGVTCGTVTGSPGAAPGGGWSPRRTACPTGSGVPRTSRQRGTGR
jgi:hypothetical protein